MCSAISIGLLTPSRVKEYNCEAIGGRSLGPSVRCCDAGHGAGEKSGWWVCLCTDKVDIEGVGRKHRDALLVFEHVVDGAHGRVVVVRANGHCCWHKRRVFNGDAWCRGCGPNQGGAQVHTRPSGVLRCRYLAATGLTHEEGAEVVPRLGDRVHSGFGVVVDDGG